MTIDKILPVAKRHLLLANAIVWGAPGVKIRTRCRARSSGNHGMAVPRRRPSSYRRWPHGFACS